MNKFIAIFKPNKSKKFNNLLNILGIKNKKEIYKKDDNNDNNYIVVNEFYIKCNISSTSEGTPLSDIVCTHVLYNSRRCLYSNCTNEKLKGYNYLVLKVVSMYTTTNIIEYIAIPALSLKDKTLNDKPYKITNYEDFVKEYAISLNKSIDEVKEQFVEITAEEFWNQYENWV